MKPKFLVALCLTLLIALAGCGQKATEQKQDQNQQQNQAQEDKGIFSSIKDAFDRSLALRCEYTDDNGEKSVNYIKNKMIRTETVDPQGQQIIGLFKEDKLYLWTVGTVQGMVFPLESLQGNDDVKMGDTAIHGTGDIINELEGRKDKCQTTNVADSLFDLPSDVTFSDLNQLLQQFGQ